MCFAECFNFLLFFSFSLLLFFCGLFVYFSRLYLAQAESVVRMDNSSKEDRNEELTVIQRRTKARRWFQGKSQKIERVSQSIEFVGCNKFDVDGGASGCFVLLKIAPSWSPLLECLVGNLSVYTESIDHRRKELRWPDNAT